MNLITLDIFEKLGLHKKKIFFESPYPLVGLGDKLVLMAGVTNLIVVIKREKFKREIYVEFAVIDIPLLYNAIFSDTYLTIMGSSLTWSIYT